MQGVAVSMRGRSCCQGGKGKDGERKVYSIEDEVVVKVRVLVVEEKEVHAVHLSCTRLIKSEKRAASHCVMTKSKGKSTGFTFILHLPLCLNIGIRPPISIFSLSLFLPSLSIPCLPEPKHLLAQAKV